MKVIDTLSKLIVSSKTKQKLSKEKNNYLLSVLALAALPDKIFADNKTPEKIEIKGYLIDVSKLAKDAGIEVSDIEELVIALADPSYGQLIYLGNGIYQFIPSSSGILEISFTITNADASQSNIVSLSLEEILPLDGGTIDYSDFDVSDFQGSLISNASVTIDVDLVAMGAAGVVMAVAMISKSSTTTTTTTETTESLAGVISEGLLSNAQVFLDLDGDAILDWTDANANSIWDDGEGEQWTLSAEDGSYTLSDISAADIAAGTLIGQAYKIDGVSQTVDMISGSDVANIMMMADASATVITPLTSLVKSGISNANILDILGLDDTAIDINSFNPFSTENHGTANSIAFEKVATKLFTTVNTIAEAIDSSAGDDLDAGQGFILAMTEVATKIGEEIAVRAANEAIDGEAAALEAEADALQAIVDAAGDDVTAAQTAAVTAKEAEVTAKNVEATTDKVSDEITALVTSVSTAIINVNTQIDSITAFDVATAKDTLNIGADTLTTQVKAAVESGTSISLSADTLVKLSEDDTSISFTAVAGTATSLTGFYGDIADAGDGAWTYTLHTSESQGQAQSDGDSYQDTFTITDSNDDAHSVTVTVFGKDDAAVITAADDTIAEGTATVSATATHTDVDSDDVANVFTAVSTATDSANGYGTYTVTSAGVWTYTLNSDHATVDALGASESTTDTITVTSGDGTTEDIAITITGVNDAPVFTSSATASAPENGTAAAIITATDVESDAITYSISGTDSALFSIVASTGVLTFVTAPDYELTDPVADDNTYTLTVTASDGTVTVDQALTVTVTNVEGGPVFSSAATFAVDENQTAIATLTASDDENDTIAFTISGGDDAASFSLASGVLTFAASPNYEVKSSYSLTVTASETTDTNGATIASPNTTDQAITVSINDINDAAVITAADGTIAEGTATLSATATHTDADTGNDDNTFLAVSDVASTYGTYSVTAAGVWTYTLNSAHATIDALGASQSTTDTITVTAEDGTTEDVTITITGTNDAAVIAGTSTGAITEDAATTTATGTLTHTDVDANNDANVFTAVSSATDSAKGYGTYTMTAAGVWTYTIDNTDSTVNALAAAATTTDTFAVTTEDGTSQTVTVTITGANDAPATVADSVTIAEDASATVISVLDNDSDPEGTTVALASKSAATNGGTVANNGDGTVSYTPVANFNGSDTFTYTATDGTDASAQTTVTVTISAVNDDPTGSVTITGDAKTGQTLTASNDLADADGLGTITYQWSDDGTAVSGATNATLVLDDDDIGSAFTVTASYTDDDGTAESATSSATSAVTDIDKAFMFTSEIIAASAAPDGGYALDPSENIIKLTLNVDMARISDSSVDSILGGVLDFSLDWSKIEAIEYDDDSTEPYVSAEAAITDLDSATTFSKFFALSHSESTADQFDTVTITSLHVSGNPPFLTLVDDTDTTLRNQVDHDSENDLAYIYLNPIDSISSLDITFGGLVNINQGDDADVTQLSYTSTVDIL